MIEIIMFGLILSLISVSFYGSRGRSYAYSAFNCIAFILFVSLGIVLLLFSYFGFEGFFDRLVSAQEYVFISVISYFFAFIFLVSYIASLDIKREYTVKRGKKVHGLQFLLVSGVITIILAALIWIIYLISPSFVMIFFSIVRSRGFFILITVVLAIIFILILLGPLSVQFSFEHLVERGERITIVRQRGYAFPIIVVVLVFLCYCMGSYFEGALYEGASQKDASSALGVIYWSIMASPAFILVVVLVVIAGLAKTVASGRAMMLVTNVLILWLPAFTWVLVFVGVIKPPTAIIKLFQDVEFIAYIVYLCVYGTLMMGLSGIISIFMGFRPLTE